MLLVDEEVVQTLAGADPAALITTKKPSRTTINIGPKPLSWTPATEMTKAG
jgi:hypothetical protein